MSSNEEKKSPPFYASVCIIDSTGQILLGKRTEDGFWTMPGGGGDEGETPEKAAVREAFEEAGIAIDQRLLQPLPSSTTRNGKTCYCFLYVCSPGRMVTSALDPDQEVRKWNWYSMDNLPKGIREHKPKFDTIRHGYMKFHGITKSLSDKLVKGGPGSGVQGHVTNQIKGDEIIRVNSKLQELNPVETELHKLENGAVWEGKTLRSGKPLFLNMDQATAHGYTPEEHREAGSIHYEAFQKMNEVANKIKASGKEVPKAVTKLEKFHERQFRSNMSQADRIATRSKKTELAVKEKERESSVSKSIVSMGHGSQVEIDTAKFSDEVANLDESPWYEQIFQRMTHYEYGQEPAIINLPAGTLHLVRVDDGMYSGVFKTSTFVDGAILEDNSKVRIDKMSIPAIVHLCEAQGWLMVMSESKPEQIPMESTPVPVPAVVEPVISVSSEDRTIRILELVNKLLS